MAPRKEPKTLLNLSYKALSNLVLDKCQAIDGSYALGQWEWEAGCLTLQRFLLNHIPPRLWDSVCEAVFSRAETIRLPLRDCTVLYSTLICRYTKKLTIECLCQSAVSYDFYKGFDLRMIAPETSVDLHRDFWLKLFAKLDNVEHFANETYATTDKGSPATWGLPFLCLIERCRQLRHLRFSIRPSSLECVARALEMFPHLEQISCLNMGEVLSSWRRPDLLNLRHFAQLGRCTASHVAQAAALCPHLCRLQFNPTVDLAASEDIFGALSESSIRLDALNVQQFCFGPAAERYFTTKGGSITTLEIRIAMSGVDLYHPISTIGRHCRNLSTLKVYHHNDTFHWNRPTRREDGLFGSLRTLKCYGMDAIPTLCLASSSMVTSFDYGSYKNDMSDDEFVAMLDPAWVTKVTSLALSPIRSEKVLKHVYEHCPEITNVFAAVTGNVDDIGSFDSYVNALKKEIADKNLNLKIEYSRMKLETR